jgi:hypothetical protein
LRETDLLGYKERSFLVPLLLDDPPLLKMLVTVSANRDVRIKPIGDSG